MAKAKYSLAWSIGSRGIGGKLELLLVVDIQSKGPR